MDGKGIIITLLGFVAGAIILSSAALPLGLAPTIGNRNNVTNSTALSYVMNTTALVTNFSTFTLTNVDTGIAGRGTVTWQTFNTNHLNVTTKTGTVLVTSTVSPALFNLTAAQLSTALTLNFSSNSTATGQAPNITSVTVEYTATPMSTQQGWDAGVTTLYKIIVPIAMIVAFMVLVLG